MQKNFTYEKQEVFYHVYGHGNPVLLLHGFGEDSKVWDEQVAFLQKDCLLIVPDLPGSGLSKIEGDAKQFPFDTIEFYADCVHALLRHENIASCTIFGHSMGGYIMLALIEKNPEMVEGFGLVHSTAFADSEEKKQNRAKGIEIMEQYGSYHFLKTTTPNLFSAGYKRESPEKVEALIEAGKAFEVTALQNYYRAMMSRKDRTAVLRGSKVPVLFIIGTDDVAVTLKDSLKQTYMPETSYIHVHDSVGHMGMWEKANEVNHQLLQFVNR